MSYRWLTTGDEAFGAMVAAIASARESVCLETYIYSDCELGRQIRDAMVAAGKKGVKVRVLIDSFGSYYLPTAFWDPVCQVQGEVRWFNPLSLARWGIRNHRKLLVCDHRVAIVGGYNIAVEYQGDGVHKGFRDVGLQLESPMVKDLEKSFDQMFDLAEFRHKLFARYRAAAFAVAKNHGGVLRGGPGRGINTFKTSLVSDLREAQHVKIVAAYFLPTWNIRRLLRRLAKAGGQVELLLAGVSDVPASRLAGQGLYTRLLAAGIRIYEYQPQVLHGKLIIMDDLVYIGSANLDLRSLGINYELMVRLQNRRLAHEAAAIFEDMKTHSRQIKLEEWQHARSFWQKLKEKWAYFLVARVDTFFARRQMYRLR